MKFTDAVKEAETTAKKADKHIAKKRAAWNKTPRRDNGPTACDGTAGKTGNPEVLARK